MMVEISGAVVVGYDGSEQSNVALEWAATEAQRRDTRLVVVHAVRHGEPAGLKPKVIAPAEDAADLVAEEGTRRARELVPELTVHALARRQGAAAAMQELSREAALVVVGHRGRGRLGMGPLGSVAFATSTHAECPVVVVRGSAARLPGPDHPVVVGTDGSDSATSAVRYAADVAAQTDTSLVIATAWEVPAANPWTTAYLADVHAVEKAAEAAQQEARDVLAHARQVCHETHPHLVVETGSQRGRPEHVLLEASERAALLVVGSRGHNDLAGLLLGSVSRAMIHRATCPVAVVR